MPVYRMANGQVIDKSCIKLKLHKSACLLLFFEAAGAKKEVEASRVRRRIGKFRPLRRETSAKQNFRHLWCLATQRPTALDPCRLLKKAGENFS